MIVAHKDSLNLRLPHQSEGSLTARDRSLETKLVGRAAGKAGSSMVLGDHRLYFQTLREMLESDNYQVALVPRGRGNLVPESPTASAVLIPFRWTELVAHVREFVRDSITL